MKILTTILLLAFAPLANAATLQQPISFDTPTTRTDGTSLGLSEIGKFVIYCGNETGLYNRQADITQKQLPRTTVNTVPDSLLILGANYCVIEAVDVDGRESAYSDEIVITGVNPIMPPKPPTNITPAATDAILDSAR